MLLIIYLVLFYFFPQWQCIDLEEVIVSNQEYLYYRTSLPHQPQQPRAPPGLGQYLASTIWLRGGENLQTRRQTSSYSSLPPCLPLSLRRNLTVPDIIIYYSCWLRNMEHQINTVQCRGSMFLKSKFKEKFSSPEISCIKTQEITCIAKSLRWLKVIIWDEKMSKRKYCRIDIYLVKIWSFWRKIESCPPPSLQWGGAGKTESKVYWTFWLYFPQGRLLLFIIWMFSSWTENGIILFCYLILIRIRIKI